MHIIPPHYPTLCFVISMLRLFYPNGYFMKKRILWDTFLVCMCIREQLHVFFPSTFCNSMPQRSVVESTQLPYRIVYLVGYFRQLPYVKNSSWIWSVPCVLSHPTVPPYLLYFIIVSYPPCYPALLSHFFTT
jgi:hypothetical protein